MRQLELTLTLLHKASQDVAVMERLAQDETIEDETIGFHAQQAVEKALKAWLAHLGANYPKAHSLELLLDILETQGLALPPDLRDVERLTPFATVFRYEALPIDTPMDRVAVLRQVKGICAFVEAIVSSPR